MIAPFGRAVRRLGASALLVGCGESFAASPAAFDPPVDDDAGDAGDEVLDQVDAGDEVLDQVDAGDEIPGSIQVDATWILDAGDELDACPVVDPTTPNIPCGCAAAPAPGCELVTGCRWGYVPAVYCAQECGLVPCR